MVGHRVIGFRMVGLRMIGLMVVSMGFFMVRLGVVILIIIGLMFVFHMVRVKVRRGCLLVVVRVVRFRVWNLAVVFIPISMILRVFLVVRLMMVWFVVVGFHMVVPIRYNIDRVVRRGKVCWGKMCRVQSSACRSEAVEARTMNLTVEAGSSVVSMVTRVSQGDGHQETQHLG